MTQRKGVAMEVGETAVVSRILQRIEDGKWIDTSYNFKSKEKAIGKKRRLEELTPSHGPYRIVEFVVTMRVMDEND